MTWTSGDTWLVVAALGSIAVIVALITAGKVHAFIALTIGSAGRRWRPCFRCSA